MSEHLIRNIYTIFLMNMHRAPMGFIAKTETGMLINR